MLVQTALDLIETRFSVSAGEFHHYDAGDDEKCAESAAEVGGIVEKYNAYQKCPCRAYACPDGVGYTHRNTFWGKVKEVSAADDAGKRGGKAMPAVAFLWCQL